MPGGAGVPWKSGRAAGEEVLEVSEAIQCRTSQTLLLLQSERESLWKMLEKLCFDVLYGNNTGRQEWKQEGSALIQTRQQPQR